MGTCVQMYGLLNECVYVHDPVRLRLRHLYQVKCLHVDEDGPGWGNLGRQYQGDLQIKNG